LSDVNFQDKSTLRVVILTNKYKKNIETIPKICNENFGESIIKVMELINKPYNTRDHDSIYYSDDYVNYYKYDNENFTQLNGLTNNKYFNINSTCNFISKTFVLPSDALNAFIIGPTFADCGNVIQICLYKYIYDLVGINKFNNLFGKILNRFLITPYLFDSLETKINTNCFLSIHPIDPTGNPLYFLFDIIEDLNNLESGDIVHIGGVELYSSKHLCGFSLGWNLICIKNNGITKFIGFGPESFKTSLTYEELKIILINNYNKDQSNETKKRISSILDNSESQIKSNIDYKQDFNLIVAQTAKLLENDKVSLDSKINGLIIGIRLNPFKEVKNWDDNHCSVEELKNLEVTPRNNPYELPKSEFLQAF